MCEDCGSTPLTDAAEKAGFPRCRLLGAAGAAVASAGLVAATGCSAAAPGPVPAPPLELVLLGTFSGPPVDPYARGPRAPSSSAAAPTWSTVGAAR